jgi:hypothetical protein
MVAYSFRSTHTIRWIRKSAMLARKIIATALLMALPAIAPAKDYAVTVYGGYRGGGSFTDADTEQSLKLDASGAVSLAVRVEARGYATLVNSSGGVFCSGGCVVSIKGDSVTQGEVMLGLSSRF